MKDKPEVYTVAVSKWICEKMAKDTNWTVIQIQKGKRGYNMVTMMRHNCGRPKKE